MGLFKNRLSKKYVLSSTQSKSFNPFSLIKVLIIDTAGELLILKSRKFKLSGVVCCIKSHLLALLGFFDPSTLRSFLNTFCNFPHNLLAIEIFCFCERLNFKIACSPCILWLSCLWSGFELGVSNSSFKKVFDRGVSSLCNWNDILGGRCRLDLLFNLCYIRGKTKRNRGCHFFS